MEGLGYPWSVIPVAPGALVARGDPLGGLKRGILKQFCRLELTLTANKPNPKPTPDQVLLFPPLGDTNPRLFGVVFGFFFPKQTQTRTDFPRFRALSPLHHAQHGGLKGVSKGVFSPSQQSHDPQHPLTVPGRGERVGRGSRGGRGFEEVEGDLGLV